MSISVHENTITVEGVHNIIYSIRVDSDPYGLIEAFNKNRVPEKAIIKCGYCGSWGAIYCNCHKCGAPIE